MALGDLLSDIGCFVIDTLLVYGSPPPRRRWLWAAGLLVVAVGLFITGYLFGSSALWILGLVVVLAGAFMMFMAHGDAPRPYRHQEVGT